MGTKHRLRNVTQAEVARSLGIHQTTVSAILSGKRAEEFAPEMQERVREAARQLGYRPSAPARTLRGARSGLIGVLHFGRDKDVESHRLRRIVSSIHEAGYRPLAMPMAPEVMWLDKRDEISACTVMLDARVEGLVFSGYADDFDQEQIRHFADAGIPMVSVTGVKLPGIAYFGADRYQAAWEMTSHLIGLGRRRLIYLHRWPSALVALAEPIMSRPVEGFRDAARERGLSAQDAVVDVRPSLTSQRKNSFEAGASAIAEIWEGGARPDAVLCYDDSYAVGVYGYCQRHAIRIPEEVAVVGYEAQALGQHLHPALTSIAVPYEEIARRALRYLSGVIREEAPPEPDACHFMPCSLVIRESCGAKG